MLLAVRPESPVRRRVVAALCATIGLTLPATAARAGPRYAPVVCPAPPAAAPVIAQMPWPHQRFAPDRLSGLADGRGLTVAVIDSGVDARHPQLSGAVAAGLDLLDTAGDGRTDCVGHGTAVASIVAARAQDGIAFRGLAPAATILPMRVSERITLDDATAGRAASATTIGEAIRQAVDRGARVINLSLATRRDDAGLRTAIEYAVARDAVVVAAVGNRYDAGNPTPYPAAYPGVIGVGGVQPDGSRAPGSQIGPYVDIVAPGADVVAAAPGRGHARFTGTSFAAAYVSATAALVRQYQPALSAGEVAARLFATADPPPGQVGGPDVGAGIVNPYRAVTAPMDPSRPEALPALTRPATDPTEASANAPSRSRRWAYRLAAAGAAIAVLIAVAAAVVPRGARRRWRPGTW